MSLQMCSRRRLSIPCEKDHIVRVHLASFVTAASIVVMQPAVSALGADKVKFLLDWFPSGEVCFPYIGIKEGFFAAEDIDVTVDIGRGGADAVVRVANGADDFGGAALNPLMTAAAESKAPLKAVMSVYTKQPDAIFTPQGSPIKTIKDLAGRSLATATFSSSNALWPVIARANGLDPESVKLLKVDNNALGPMLASGRVDATITWVTSGPADARLLKQAGKQLSILPWTAVGLEGYGWSILASDKIIKEHPDTVRRFVRAFIKTVEFTAKNPEKAGQDLHDLVPNADLDSNTDEIRATVPLVKNEITEKYGMGSLDPAWLQKTWEWVAKAQGYPLDKVNPETLVDRSFLPKP
jgi:NitT/TauT family transport system substrate-binding protein